MARATPPGQMLWAVVQLKLSFDPQKELDSIIADYCSQLDAIEPDANGVVASEQRALIDASKPKATIGEKRSRTESAETCARSTRARKRRDEARSNDVPAEKSKANMAPKGRKLQTKEKSSARAASDEKCPAKGSGNGKRQSSSQCASADQGKVSGHPPLGARLEDETSNAKACQDPGSPTGHREGVAVQDRDRGRDSVNVGAATTTNVDAEPSTQSNAQARHDALPNLGVLHEIAKEPEVLTDRSDAMDVDMQGKACEAGHELNYECGPGEDQQDVAGTPCRQSDAEAKGCTNASVHDVRPEADTNMAITAPEHPVEESPSLGVHAQGAHVEDADDTSGGENWLGSVEDGANSPEAANAPLLSGDGHDLPCADAGDAHVVDLAPGESPSPLPPGVWAEHPDSDTSISLPQLDGGRASRDSTPRMFAGGMEGRDAHGGHKSVRKSPQAAPLADLQSQLHQLHASAVAKKTSLLAKDVMKNSAGFKGTAVSEPTSITGRSKSSDDNTAGHAVEPEGAAEVRGKEPLLGINFFSGGSLLQKMREQDAERARPAFGNHGKPVIKAIQAAQKVKAQADKAKEKREAHKRALQDVLAAKRVQKAHQTGITSTAAQGASAPPFPAGTKRAVAGKPAAALTPEAVARLVAEAPPVTASASKKTPEKPEANASENNMCNVTPTRLRHDLAASTGPAVLVESRNPAPRTPQYAVTPLADLESVSDEESDAVRLNRAIKVRPTWGLKANTKRTAEQQICVDPAKVLGPFLHTGDLTDLFSADLDEKLIGLDKTVVKPDRMERYKARRASARWDDDAISDAEVQRYDRARGYRSG